MGLQKLIPCISAFFIVTFISNVALTRDVQNTSASEALRVLLEQSEAPIYIHDAWQSETLAEQKKVISKRASRSPLTLPARATLALSLSDTLVEATGTDYIIGGIWHNPANGVLTIGGNDSNDVASITGGRDGVEVQLNREIESFPYAAISKILFVGHGGNDKFSNVTAIPVTAYGLSGDDVLIGGKGSDLLIGGSGNDSLYGNASDDELWGGADDDLLVGGDGNDSLFGHSGKDRLYGGRDRDLLNGGTGTDNLYGDQGQDLLVSVGGGVDTLKGGAQWDNFWLDNSDSIVDASPNEISKGYVHNIASFRSVQYPSQSPIAVSLEPQGEDLPDPLPYDTHSGLSIQNFDNYPLFSSAGPSIDDVFQGAVGDCYFLARLSALAAAEPEFIRKTIAPLGDGSYAVRFERNGQQDYVRVDSDLWLGSDDAPKYAGIGQEGAIWVALIEKAFAIARNDVAAYPSINNGNALTLSQLPISKESVVLDDGLTAATVKNWHDAGELDGSTKTTVHGNARFLLYVMRAQLEAGIPLITGAVSGVSDHTGIQLDNPGTASNESTYRRGQHVYAIDSVLNDRDEVPNALVLRDPFGQYRTITDLTRIYFCISNSTSILL